MSPDVMHFIYSFWPFALLFAFFYFVIIRPQKKEQKRRTEMLQSLRRGDEIITLGGVHGTIIALTDDIVTLKIAEKVEIKLSRSSVGSKKD